MTNKSKWAVYKRYVFIDDSPYYSHEGVWEYMGETWAVSEQKAINNVRFRNGYSSQHRPLASGSSWMEHLEWEARPI